MPQTIIIITNFLTLKRTVISGRVKEVISSHRNFLFLDVISWTKSSTFTDSCVKCCSIVIKKVKTIENRNSTDDFHWNKNCCDLKIGLRISISLRIYYLSRQGIFWGQIIDCSHKCCCHQQRVRDDYRFIQQLHSSECFSWKII